uniref:Lactamase_B domain-containing protein n=1 Tax=Haemonchus contortus TaxID=6289 RepID=A0A7I4YNB9_HAECO
MSDPSSSSNISEAFAKPVRKYGRYYNPPCFESWTGLPGPRKLLWWALLDKDESNIPDNESILDKTVPVHQITKFVSPSNRKMFATWLGHSTVLVQMEGVRFITDPIWSKRASFLQSIGPRRYRPPPMEMEDLPEIHFAVISHDHYDHLDVDTVIRINSFNPSMRWFVPGGILDWMSTIGIRNTDEHPDKVTEMEWGDNISFVVDGKKVTVWCLPAQHWGQRGLFDRNERLWSGWAVMTPNRRFYYTGDTGFCDKEFKKIGDLLGPFDLAAIPIGAYNPRWMLQPEHIDPHEAILVHELVKSKFSIGIHWGTYHMGSHELYLEPKELLERIGKETGHASNFVILEMGQIWEDNGDEDSGIEEV